ncbi:alanine racemase [Caulobacter mirabilis]|uniref:Alanine racemase n=1 Tax=Caulobacter mirabilis TaxID=69666 RepID=A0A2D2AZ48_9CAUL|nr:alanine racemase [Caulobacter mirabilis]ATQ43264.1 alanine racemase [Caulobacter mirabilis]
MTTRLTIDLDALARNYALVRRTAGVEAAPAVKADGYGLGAIAAARRLVAEGATTFYVARLDEGLALRQALGSAPVIQVLDGVTDGVARPLVDAGLTPVVNSLDQAERWLAEGDGSAVTLHVDTGMNRLGVTLAEAAGLRGRLAVAQVMSHLACAAEPDHPMNAAQLAAFRDARSLFPDALASLAASAGTFLGPDYRFDQVRPGITLYGGGPFDAFDPRIAPVATVEAAILQVRHVPAGDAIGYGAAFVAETPMAVAIVAAGYADGVPRSSHPRGAAWFAGKRRRLLGRVSMDMVAVDVTGCADARPGAMMELIGPNLPVDEAAAAAGTTAYELLTRLSGRAERRRLGG